MRAQRDLLQIQVQMLAKLRCLNERAINDLYASQGDDHGRVSIGDVEDKSSTCPLLITGAS